MAAARSLQGLRDEATCSICLELFTDPVIIVGCGHNFCRACIAQCWEGAETDVACPQCRQTFDQRLLGPNRQLGNLVDLVKGLSVGSAEGAGGTTVCEQHGEALKLFCETDQVLMCVICRESRAHRAHAAAPVQEAAQQCKEQLETQLQLLRGERTRLEALRGSESQKHQEYQQKAAAERQKIVAAFEQLHQFLEEQERLVLAELGELESGIGKSQGETVTHLSEEISHLDSLIGELEGKCQQAASDLLQDMRSTLSRCKKEQFQLPEGICPQLETRLSILSGQALALQKTLKKFQATWEQHPETAEISALQKAHHSNGQHSSGEEEEEEEEISSSGEEEDEEKDRDAEEEEEEPAVPSGVGTSTPGQPQPRKVPKAKLACRNAFALLGEDEC